jgi:hypothetical protein
MIGEVFVLLPRHARVHARTSSMPPAVAPLCAMLLAFDLNNDPQFAEKLEDTVGL